MIFDTLKNSEFYAYLGERFQAAFEYLRSTDLLSLEPGRYEIQGNDVYVMIQNPTLAAWEDGRWESHALYADIQLVLEGRECMGCSVDENAPVDVPYDAEKDVTFYSDFPGNAINVNAGEMLIFFPQDIHRPSLRASDGPAADRKAVVKVRL